MIFDAKNKIIQYRPTPKCGCTSTKVMIHKGINGQIANYGDDIHDKYTTSTFIDWPYADIKFCIVRDPVSRFISAYSNRVCRHNDIKFVEFDEFIDGFCNKYYESNESIYHHFRPQVDFIGRNPDYYDRIFFLDEMPLVSEFLSEIMGKPIKLEKLQVGKIDKPIPTETQINFIKSLYEDDYMFLEQIKK